MCYLIVRQWLAVDIHAVAGCVDMHAVVSGVDMYDVYIPCDTGCDGDPGCLAGTKLFCAEETTGTPQTLAENTTKCI